MKEHLKVISVNFKIFSDKVSRKKDRKTLSKKVNLLT